MNKLLIPLICTMLILAAGCQRRYESRRPVDVIPPRSIERPYPPNASPQLKQLIEGATEQAGVTVSYDPSYVGIAYPGGDVATETGVCSDVVVRAFRKAGIDLQQETHEDMVRAWLAYPTKWGARGPDTNIFPEDYRALPVLSMILANLCSQVVTGVGSRNCLDRLRSSQGRISTPVLKCLSRNLSPLIVVAATPRQSPIELKGPHIMRSRTFAIAFLPVAIFSLSVQAQTSSQGKRDAKAVAAIRAVLESQRQAWNRGDIEGYMDGYSRSDDIVFISTDSVTRGWQTVHDRYQKNYNSREKMGTLTFSDLEVTLIEDDVAVIIGSWRLQRASDEPHGKFTLILRRMKPGWRIVHDHTS